MKIISLVVLSCLILLTSCMNGVTGNGAVQQRQFAFEAFSGIDCGLPGKVIFEQGAQYVSVRTNENLFDYFDFEVRNGILYLDLQDRISIMNFDELEIIIVNPTLSRFEVDGSADMISDKPVIVEGDMVLNIDGSGDIKMRSLSCSKLNMEIDGSGDMDIQKIEGERLECNIDGSGDISLAGVAEKFEIDIDGSGDVKASDLRVDDADIDINGSGSCHVWVEDDLEIRINGSGSVFYKGQPDLKTEVNGSGDVKKQK